MLEIHERTDTKGYEDKVQNINSEFVHVVESINGESVNGYGIYSIDENGLKIYDFDGEKWDITDGEIRTILFKGMLGGLNRCEFFISDAEKNKKLKTLGFVKDGVNSIDDINDLMSNCKKCKE